MSQTIRNFLKGINLLLRAPNPETFKTNALIQLQTLVRFDSGLWIEARPGTGYLYEHSRTLFHQPDSMMDNYFAKAAAEDVLAEAAMLAPTTTIDIDNLFSRKELLNYSGYTEHMKKFNIEHCLCTAVPHDDTGVFSFISLYRAKEGDFFCESERQKAEDVMVFLSDAYKNSLFYSLLSVGTPQFDDKAMVICDTEGVIYQQSQRWHTIAHNLGLNPLPGTIPECLFNSLTKEGTFYLNNITLRISPLKNNLVYIELQPPTAAALLSPSEHKVAKLYIEGKTRDEIAEQLSRSPHTIKNHLNKIFDKLNVKNKIELGKILLD